MGSLRQLIRRLWGMLLGHRDDDRLEEELRAHIQLAAEDLQRRGTPREEAIRAARIQAGGIAQALEAMRDQRGLPWLDDLVRDVRHGLRALRQSPVFSLVAILSLALGIGANTALFSMIDTFVLKKLPVRNPDELVLFQWTSSPNPRFVTSMTFDATFKDAASGLNTNQTFPYPILAQFQENGGALSNLFAFARLYPFTLIADDQAEVTTGQLVSGNYFASLGVDATVGRTIGEADDNPSAALVAVISHHFWEKRFALAATVIGKTITINNQPLTIVGVTPPGFEGTLQVDDSPDLFLPMSAAPAVAAGYSLTRPDEWWMWIMGRLKPGMNPNQVRDSLQGVFERTVLDPAAASLAKDLMKPDAPHLGVVSGSRGLADHRNQLSRSLLALSIIVCLVLLIACSNVANLLLARAKARQKEIAVRLAIGAGRFRLIRQLLTESILLAGCGGACGMFMAYFGKAFLQHWGPWSGSDMTLTPILNVRVFAFTIAVSLLTGLVFGLAPALGATRVDLKVPMKSTERMFAGGFWYMGKGLLIGQVALSMVLLIGAGLFVRTLNNLYRAVTGMDSSNVLQFSIDANQYTAAVATNRVEAILEGIQAIPGVRSATLSGSDRHGADPGNNGQNFSDMAGRRYTATFVAARSNYFETMGIPFASGRTFTPADSAGAPRVLIINEAFARKYFDGENPLGKILAGSEVIGVVRDSKYTQLRKDVLPTIYTSYRQEAPGRAKIWVRTAVNLVSLLPAVRQVVRDVDPHLAVSDVKTLADQIDQSVGGERMLAAFSSLFGALALVLTGVGLYGIMAYGVARRTNEIGIRMAIGAQRGDVIRLVVKEGMLLVTIGAATGIAVAVATGRFAASILYGIAPHDPVSIFLAIVIIFGVALLACYIPARRASRVDPTIALRYE